MSSWNGDSASGLASHRNIERTATYSAAAISARWRGSASMSTPCQSNPGTPRERDEQAPRREPVLDPPGPVDDHLHRRGELAGRADGVRPARRGPARPPSTARERGPVGVGRREQRRHAGAVSDELLVDLDGLRHRLAGLGRLRRAAPPGSGSHSIVSRRSATGPPGSSDDRSGGNHAAASADPAPISARIAARARSMPRRVDADRVPDVVEAVPDLQRDAGQLGIGRAACSRPGQSSNPRNTIAAYERRDSAASADSPATTSASASAPARSPRWKRSKARVRCVMRRSGASSSDASTSSTPPAPSRAAPTRARATPRPRPRRRPAHRGSTRRSRPSTATAPRPTALRVPRRAGTTCSARRTARTRAAIAGRRRAARRRHERLAHAPFRRERARLRQPIAARIDQRRPAGFGLVAVAHRDPAIDAFARPPVGVEERPAARRSVRRRRRRAPGESSGRRTGSAPDRGNAGRTAPVGRSSPGEAGLLLQEARGVELADRPHAVGARIHDLLDEHAAFGPERDRARGCAASSRRATRRTRPAPAPRRAGPGTAARRRGSRAPRDRRRPRREIRPPDSARTDGPRRAERSRRGSFRRRAARTRKRSRSRRGARTRTSPRGRRRRSRW